MIKRSIMLTLLLCVSLFANGCWDAREVEQLGIVHGIAVESADNDRVRVIFQYINTSVQGGEQQSGGSTTTFQKPYRNQVIEADSIYDAVKQLPKETVARRFFAHTDVLIVSEEFARSRGIAEISDYIGRDPQFRPNVWLLVGRGKDMTSLMDTPGIITPIPTQRITNVLQHFELVSSYAPLRLGEFVKYMQSDSTQPFTAIVEGLPDPSVPAEAGHGILAGEVPEPAYKLDINGTALFKNDKMVGWLNEKESRGLLWLRGEVKQGEIRFPLPDMTGGSVTTEINRTRTKVKPVLRNDELIIYVEIHARTIIQEVTGTFPMDKQIKQLEDAQNQAIVSEVQSVLDKAQKQLQVDAFGFGEAVHREYPQQWQQMKSDWDEIFPEIQVQLEVKTRIVGTNLTSRPVDIGSDK